MKRDPVAHAEGYLKAMRDLARRIRLLDAWITALTFKLFAENRYFNIKEQEKYRTHIKEQKKCRTHLMIVETRLLNYIKAKNPSFEAEALASTPQPQAAAPGMENDASSLDGLDAAAAASSARLE